MMDQPDNATALRAEDVRRICGDMLDWKLAAILALNATAGELAAAAAWAAGRDELGQEGRPLEGLAAQVYDILVSDEFLEDER
jgi:hypothetical protein